MSKRKRLIIILLISIIIIAILGWHGYSYYQYSKIYNEAKNNESIFIGKAKQRNIPVKEDIEGYTKTTLDWITYSTPFGNYDNAKELSSSTYYFYNFKDDSKEVGIWPFDLKKNGEKFYNQLFVDALNKKFNTNIITHKDYYDIIYNTDFSKVNFFSSKKSMLLNAILIVEKLKITPGSNNIYYFENTNNRGYIIMGHDIADIRLFDEKGTSTCEFTILTSNSSANVSLETVRNIVGSIKIK